MTLSKPLAPTPIAMGIEDSTTGSTDTDGDGVPDALDPDNSGTPLDPPDTDDGWGDGLP